MVLWRGEEWKERESERKTQFITQFPINKRCSRLLFFAAGGYRVANALDSLHTLHSFFGCLCVRVCVFEWDEKVSP